MKNCAFCDTSMKFGTQLLCAMKTCFKTGRSGPQPDLACGGCDSNFQNGRHEFSMFHISANNIDMRLIIVSMSMFSWSRNPIMAIYIGMWGLWQPFSKWLT